MFSRKHNGLIKVIIGIRRCGKSYLLNNIFYKYLLSVDVKDDHVIKFAYDSAKDLKLINEKIINISTNKKKVDPLKFIEYIDNKIVDVDMYYLLLDEVQFLDNFEAVLNSFLRVDNVDVYVTGSNRFYIQSVYAILDKEKYLQETKSFDNTKDSFKKIVIVNNIMKPRRDENGYLFI